MPAVLEVDCASNEKLLRLAAKYNVDIENYEEDDEQDEDEDDEDPFSHEPEFDRGRRGEAARRWPNTMSYENSLEEQKRRIFEIIKHNDLCTMTKIRECNNKIEILPPQKISALTHRLIKEGKVILVRDDTRSLKFSVKK